MAKSVIEYYDTLKHFKEECLFLRDVALQSGLIETIKWGCPVYTTNRDENICGIAAFKSYCGIWFFQGSLLTDAKGYLTNAQAGKTKALRQWRFESIKDIKKAPILSYLKEAIKNCEAGKKVPVTKQREIEMPSELVEKLSKNIKLHKAWEDLSHSCKWEYAEYIREAKRPETKQNRLDKITPMILEKVGLNDKYKK